MNELWFVDSEKRQSVELSDGIAREKGSTGSYADMPGAQEEALIERMKTSAWRSVVEEIFAHGNPWLYRIITDPSRALGLSLLSLPERAACLDVGSGFGQLCIPLAKRGGRVVAMDLTINRLKILSQIARQEEAALDLVQGNVRSFPFANGIFDLVVLNGVLEWVGVGREAGQTIRQCQAQSLRRLREFMKPAGQMFVAIENSIGMKYLLGARDDHSGRVFDSFVIQERHDQSAKVWNLKEYEELFAEAGLRVKSAYGCFPDYKLPKHMVPLEEVDRFLAGQGMNWQECHGDCGQLLTNQESLAAMYGQVASLGLGKWFCPSYAWVLERTNG
jgi:2-polyprenyl-3-methyl-5-hydroxy-6-metoxy-1,4-benzoquinol methylase